MASKLGLYNEALGHLRERRLASLTETREPRRVLDDYYDGVLAYCLERGFWNWAMRAVEIDASDAITPQFGYANAFEKPEDWVRTYTISDSDMLAPPLLEVIDEGSIWYADCDPLYVKYVSDNAAYGMDLGVWPASFADYVALRLALRAGPRIASVSADTLEYLRTEERRALAAAMSKDAMDEPPGIPPRGTWATARGGGRGPGGKSFSSGMRF